MVSKGLTGVGLAHHSGQCDASNYDVQAHIGESDSPVPGPSYPRRRVSSTPRPVGSVTAASGILGRPPQCAIAHKAGDDSRRLFPRRVSPGLCQPFRPIKRAQGMPGACCTRGLACKRWCEMRTRAYRYSRSIPAFPAQGKIKSRMKSRRAACSSHPIDRARDIPIGCHTLHRPSPTRSRHFARRGHNDHGTQVTLQRTGNSHRTARARPSDAGRTPAQRSRAAVADVPPQQDQRDMVAEGQRWSRQTMDQSLCPSR